MKGEVEILVDFNLFSQKIICNFKKDVSLPIVENICLFF